MDPDKKDILNNIENSMYRTAFKLRSVQTLCQLDLIDSSLIEQVLLHGRFWEARESSLSVHQLLQALQDLFQRTREGKSGQMNPRASELTLSLLRTMYDSKGTGFLKLLPVAASLIALSGDTPLTKYRALFQLYAENNKGDHDSGARMTQKILRSLLRDLQQIPTLVGESHTLCPVESAVRSCFQGVLSPGIKEEKFLSWIQSEPHILLWLPICHRLSATEMVTHPVRCSVCRTIPIVGLRYRCLKCLNFDICQVCFLSGLHSKFHQKSHPVIEHCVQRMSAMESTKLLLRTLRKNLLQGCCGRKEAMRKRWQLDQVNPKDMADHAQATVLKQQFSQYKEKLQAFYTYQEEKSCRFETKIHALTIHQESLWTRLQQVGQDLQAVLQPLHPVSSHQNTMSRVDHFSAVKPLDGGDFSQMKNVTENSPEWEPLPNPAIVNGSQADAENALPNLESSETLLQSTRLQSYAQNIPKEILSSLPSCQEGLLQEDPQISPPEKNRPARVPAERKEMANIKERNDDLEKEEVQELLSKFMNAFNLEKTPGPQSSVNMDLYGKAEQVCRAFSALVDQITFPNFK
ncbi:dystrotelin [Marmota monax]|uniref:dystrotelin n=1 Tax=Marmota monax TaxID=9995 RepID=UPI001EB0A3C8|nr:dystrotelin [Marmota monax]KAI6051642.1 DYTN [Marmota monax]KAI6062225.1 DYTN [Marmota monax]